ncbi:hypothetical protein QBC40DRAFT_353066 [Triangularia verruculosa]|uniref:Uncharacterized protein n=1 Tax=Triangularia verruculosa TaxID=2587418 RepID=A0AAN6X9V6_9PEZI|nr:hypothetical protein QBC40DRAFT_353066 [Triangularia verruculosa]
MEKTATTTSAHSAAPSFQTHVEPDHHLQSKMKSLRTIDTLRVGTTALALLMGVTVLGTSGNTLRVYEETHITTTTPHFFLPLWPEQFNIRPTVSLVVGSVFVAIASIASLCCSKISALRKNSTLHTSASLAAPVIGLIASLISVVFFYAVNASDTVDTFTSWTCRWQEIPMGQQPDWGTLCRQSYAGLYLAILLIPVEAAGLGLAVWQGRVGSRRLPAEVWALLPGYKRNS